MATAGLFACYQAPSKRNASIIRGFAMKKSDDEALRDALLSILRGGLLRMPGAPGLASETWALRA